MNINRLLVILFLSFLIGCGNRSETVTTEITPEVYTPVIVSGIEVWDQSKPTAEHSIVVDRFTPDITLAPNGQPIYPHRNSVRAAAIEKAIEIDADGVIIITDRDYCQHMPNCYSMAPRYYAQIIKYAVSNNTSM